MELDASERERRQLAYSTQVFDLTPVVFVDNYLLSLFLVIKNRPVRIGLEEIEKL